MHTVDDKMSDRLEQRQYQELNHEEKLTFLLTRVFNHLTDVFCDSNLLSCKIDTVIIDKKDGIRHCSISNGFEVGTNYLYFDNESQLHSQYLPIDDEESKSRNQRCIVNLNEKHYQKFQAKLTHFFFSRSSSPEEMETPLDALTEAQCIGSYDGNALVFIIPIGFRELIPENSLLVLRRLFMTFAAILQKRIPNFQSILSIPNYYKAEDSILDYRATIVDACESILQWFICKNRHRYGNRDLYDTICSISSMPYEHRANTGTLAFATRASLTSKKLMRFDKPLDLAMPNIREIRKLLETSKDNAVLLVNKGRIIGIMERCKSITGIQFSGTGNWTFLIKSEPVLAFKQNNCFLVRKSGQVDVRALYRGNFPLSESVDNILNIIKIAEKQQHGTAIIISNGSEQEAERLCKLHRGIKIQPLSLADHPELIGALTSIDGAVLIDQTGICHAIGVILDGDAVIDGSTARGARYNSVKNYVERQKILMDDGCFIGVIVSEDGSVDFISTNDEMLKNNYWMIENG